MYGTSRLAGTGSRRRRRTFAAVLVAVGAAGSLAAGPPSSQPPALVDPATPAGVQPAGWPRTAGAAELVFSDEFTSSILDSAKWTALDQERDPHDGIRWWYKPANVRSNANGQGLLAIDVSNIGTDRYSGGRIQTRGKFGYHGGTIEFRVRIPPTNGHMAAVWLQHNTHGTLPGTAADGAEIDIAETAYRADRYATNIHYDGYGAEHKSAPAVVAATGLHGTYWHTFSLSWTTEYLTFRYDGAVVRTVTDKNLISLVDEFVVISHEVSAFPEGDIADEVFDSSSTMYVDYVRVWK